MVKKCPGCKEIKDSSLFYKSLTRHDGITSTCKDCIKKTTHTEEYREWMRNYMRKRNGNKNIDSLKIVIIPELEKKLGIRITDKFITSDKNKKHISRERAKYYIETKPCVICGTEEDIERHHFDYNKPLDVTFLCMKHHRKLHAELRRLYKFSYKNLS